MKKLGYATIGLLILYWVFTLLATPIIDKKFNPVLHESPYKVSKEARELYESLEFVGDLHCDALLWKRDLLKKNGLGQVDIPRIIEVNVAFQAFTIVTKSPKGQNMLKNTGETDNITSLVIAQGRQMDSWFSLYERAIDQCEALHDFAENSEGAFSVIHDKKEFESFLNARKSDRNLACGYLGVEGGHWLEGKLEFG